MRKLNPLLLLSCAVVVLLCSTCTKTVYDRRSKTTVTPESREYFGCRVNGVDFVSEASTGNVSGSCSYITKYSDSSLTFQIFSDKFESSCVTGTVGITLDSVKLEVGQSYQLGEKGPKKNYASYYFVPGCSQSRVDLYTTDEFPGYVSITKISHSKKVVMGTFYFTVKDHLGNLYIITGGIFDRHYTSN